MIGKNNWRLRKERDKNSQKIVKYAIKKFAVGAASVAISAGWFFAPDAVVAANEATAPAVETMTSHTEAIEPATEGSESITEVESVNPQVTAPVLADPAAETSPAAVVAETESSDFAPAVEVDKSGLKQLISQAESEDLTIKTEESVSALHSSLSQAKLVEGDAWATTEQVTQAVATLQAALSGLANKEVAISETADESSATVGGTIAGQETQVETDSLKPKVEDLSVVPAPKLSPALQVAQESLTMALEAPISEGAEKSGLSFEKYQLAYKRALDLEETLKKSLFNQELTQAESDQLAALATQAAITLQRRKDQLSQAAKRSEMTGFRQTAQVNANRYIKFIDMATGQDIDLNQAFNHINGQNIKIGVAVSFDENDTNKSVTIELGNFFSFADNGSQDATVKPYITSSTAQTSKVDLTSVDNYQYTNYNNKVVQSSINRQSHTYNLTDSSKQLVIPITINATKLAGLEGFATDGNINGTSIGIEKTTPITVTTRANHVTDGQVEQVGRLDEMTTPNLALTNHSTQGLWSWANHNANRTNQTIATADNNYTVVTSLALHSSREVSQYVDKATVTYTLPKGVSFVGFYDAEQENMYTAETQTDANGVTTLTIKTKYASYYGISHELPRVHAKLQIDPNEPKIAADQKVNLVSRYNVTVRNGKTYQSTANLDYHIIPNSPQDDILFFKQVEGVFTNEGTHYANGMTSKEVYTQLGRFPYDIMAYTVDSHDSREKELHYRFPENPAIQVRGIQLPFMNRMGTEISTVKIATKNSPVLREVSLGKSYTQSSGAVFIAKKELGIADNDELTELVVPIGVFKAGKDNRYTFANLNGGRESQLFGVVKDGDTAQVIQTAVLTLRDRDYDPNSTDKNWASTPGSMAIRIDPRYGRNDLTITLPTTRTLGDGQSSTLVYKVESSQLPSNTHIQRTVDEVESLYLVLPSYVTVDAIRLKDQDGKDFTAQVTQTQSTIQKDGVEHTVYKLDTSNIQGYENILGFYGPSDGNFKERFFNVEVDIDNTVTSNKVVSLNQTLFAKLGQVRATTGLSTLKANPVGLDSNATLFTNRLNPTNSLTLTAVDRLDFSNEAKLSNSATYTDTQTAFKIDDIRQSLDMKFTISNPMDKDVGHLDYYIPVPKEGQTFGSNFHDKVFDYSLDLTGAVTLSPDFANTFEVTYATVDTNKLTGRPYTTDELATETFNANPADYSKVNLIRIKTRDGVDIPAKQTFELIANYGLGSVEPRHDGMNVTFRPFYLVNFDNNTSKNENADRVSVDITLGRLALEVYEDVDGSGHQGGEETALIEGLFYEVYDAQDNKVTEGRTTVSSHIIGGLVNNQSYTIRVFNKDVTNYRFTTGTISPDNNQTEVLTTQAIFTVDDNQVPVIKVGMKTDKIAHQFDLGNYGQTSDNLIQRAFAGDKVTPPVVTATPNYVFIGWRESGSNKLLSSDEVKAVVQGDQSKTYTAEYLKQEQTVVVDVDWLKGTAPYPTQTVGISDGQQTIANLTFDNGDGTQTKPNLAIDSNYTVTPSSVTDYRTDLVKREVRQELPTDLIAYANQNQKDAQGVYTFNSLTRTYQVTNTFEVEKAALKQAAQTAKSDIEARDDLTREEKDQAKTAIEQELTKALAVVDQANNDQDRQAGQTSGETSIQDLVTNAPAQVKPVASLRIDEVAKQQIEQIKRRRDLTTDEKAEAEKEIKRLTDEAKATIASAQTNADVAQKEGEGIQKIQAVTPIAQVKPNAIKAVEDLVTKRIEEIRAMSEATTEEQDAAIAQVNTILDQARRSLQSAPTNADVDSIKARITAMIQAITPIIAEKPNARESIEQAVREKVATIENRTDLTAEEKQAAIALVKEKAEQAKGEIAKAVNNGQVTSVKDIGVAAIKAVDSTAETKPRAKADVDQAVTAKTAEINNRTDLTAEEKATALAQVKQEAETAKTAIDQAPTDAGVESAKTAGISAIKSVDPTASVRDRAKADVDQAVTDKTAEINNRTDLTAEEKTTALAQVKQEADKAKSAIDQAATDAEVKTAKDLGVSTIGAINPIADVKPRAKADVDQAVTDKTTEINNRTDLTAEEKASALAQVKQEADKAKSAIDQAPTDAAVKTAKDSGVSTIGAINPIADVKPRAKADVDQAVTAKTAEINNRTDLTAEEKATALAQVKQEAEKGKSAIDQASTDAGVESAKTAGISAIKSVDPTASVRDRAKADVDQAVTDKTTEINNRTDLTAEEKATALAQVKKEADSAKSAIDQASNDVAVKTAKDSGISTIGAINPTATVRDRAKADVDQAVTDKTTEINQRTDLTAEEKATALAQVKQEADKAKSAIDQAPTDAEVVQVRIDSVSTIEGINPSATTKNQTKLAIGQAAEDKIAEINNRTDLTARDKEVAIRQVRDAEALALVAVDQATTGTTVREASALGLDAIAAVQVSSPSNSPVSVASQVGEGQSQVSSTSLERAVDDKVSQAPIQSSTILPSTGDSDGSRTDVLGYVTLMGALLTLVASRTKRKADDQ